MTCSDAQFFFFFYFPFFLLSLSFQFSFCSNVTPDKEWLIGNEFWKDMIYLLKIFHKRKPILFFFYFLNLFFWCLNFLYIKNRIEGKFCPFATYFKPHIIVNFEIRLRLIKNINKPQQIQSREMKPLMTIYSLFIQIIASFKMYCLKFFNFWIFFLFFPFSIYFTNN